MWSTFSLSNATTPSHSLSLISQMPFCALVCMCSMPSSRAVKHVFRCGIKQQTIPNKMLDYLKGVAPRNVQIGCGQALL